MKPIQVKILFASFLLILFFSSCLNETKEATVVENNPTPQVLDGTKDKPIINTRSYSKGNYRGNVLAKLFAEAREKDGKLDSLINAMNDIDYKWGDSISNTQKFMSNNKDYYSSAQSLIQSLNDSLLKKSTAKLFKDLEEKYKSKIKTHEDLLSQIEKMKKEIHDNKILTKLYVTASMIENYQNNELPDTKPLQNIIAHYKSLIEQSKAYQK